MEFVMRQAGRRIMQGLSIAGCVLALCGTAQAQRWENLFGDTTLQTARNGVRPVTGGGYIAVGGSNIGPNEDIYVVRTDNHGLLGWSKTYSIGNADVATDIEEVLTGGVNNGFIITGYTNHGDPGDTCGNSQDIFLLRIDNCGAVMWQNTYGAATTDEYAWDVIVATVGNAGPPITNPGDFVVAGWQGSTPNRDGYLLRTTALGAPIWGQLYNLPQNNFDDYFYSLDEATVGGGAGDIIAAGGSTSFRVPANLDTWMVRVPGTGVGVTASLAYGGAATDEDLRSVQELNSGGFGIIGDIIAVGRMTTGANTDVYLLQANNLLLPVGDRRNGFNLSDEGYYVREIPGPPNVPSRVIVTGHITPPVGWGFGGTDAFLQEFTTGPGLAPFGNEFVYGGPRDDRGWSVEPIQLNTVCTRPGFIVAGFFQGTANDPQQLYMFKTDVNVLGDKTTGCDTSFTPPTQSPNFSDNPARPTPRPFTNECIPPITHVSRTWIDVLCPLKLDGTVNCPVPDCKPAPQQKNLDPDFSDRMQKNSGDAIYARGTMVMEK